MTTKSIADYAAAARRDPFTLTLDDGTAISVSQPIVDTWYGPVLEADTVQEALAALAGDQADAIRAAVGPLPAPALQQLLDDMAVAFGLGKSGS